MGWLIKLMKDNPETTIWILFGTVLAVIGIITWTKDANDKLKMFNANNRAAQMKKYEENNQNDTEHKI